MTDIIPANSIDYSNVDEVCAYQWLLSKIYECEGGFNLPAESTPATREISRQCLVWLREVKALVGSILRGEAANASLGDIPRLLQSYDLFHRIGYGAPCAGYLREVRLMTADRWVKGDRSISRTDVALLLLSETDRNVRNIGERYAKYAIGVKASWVRELVRYGEFSDASLPETYRRLSYLLRADLYAYMGRKEETEAKSQWVSAHTLTWEQIDSLDTDTLWAYADFIDSIPFSIQTKYSHCDSIGIERIGSIGIGRNDSIGIERNDSIYEQLLSKLASRPDTHPFLAKAIKLTQQRLAALIA